jgi:hypothetical protein
MAKQKKSRVTGAFGPKDRPDPNEAPKAAEKAAEALTGKKTGRGRPKANHGLTRTSVLADSDQMARLKVEAAKQRRHMYELLSEAIGDYLAKVKD